MRNLSSVNNIKEPGRKTNLPPGPELHKRKGNAAYTINAATKAKIA